MEGCTLKLPSGFQGHKGKTVLLKGTATIKSSLTTHIRRRRRSFLRRFQERRQASLQTRQLVQAASVPLRSRFRFSPENAPVATPRPPRTTGGLQRDKTPQ
ncbi:hypothetical protein L2E82_39642 [Cichorium intybus]|uniref:Uncharacterized protein n=1 Tax=Cichorium intybus TaxID=13427 RepID=A0ACB9AI29_CICIN|nr:hypothetical protein L2E82_39642 [Cichorium intybus]